MSAVARFIIFDKANINQIADSSKIITKRKLFKKEVTDNYYPTLEASSELVDEYEGNGYIYGTLLVYLDQVKSIDISSGELDKYSNIISQNRTNSSILFTQEQKEIFNQKVANIDFEGEEFQNFCIEFTGNDSEIKYAKKAIETLSYSLNKITDNSKALLVEIG